MTDVDVEAVVVVEVEVVVVVVLSGPEGGELLQTQMFPVGEKTAPRARGIRASPLNIYDLEPLLISSHIFFLGWTEGACQVKHFTLGEEDWMQKSKPLGLIRPGSKGGRVLYGRVWWRRLEMEQAESAQTQ
uniref:Uncharacterized protein n=1 Tax=Knipowitschia caucasica TaxID=637954 RepID=A0AAV2LBC9_KNICA